ncbi:MAG TPA: DUF3048 domain-containing protein [Patescibacteria group bacterium]|jgi:hypothetical protein|nr:DUF3048 domain-containing protein [Patescibacteria group bacterium]
MKKNTIVVIVTAVVLYLLATSASYLFFAKASPQIISAPIPVATTGTNGAVVFDNTLPKTEACPINGVLYSKQQEAWWQKHRPLGVMIENHVDARPQSGLSGADVIYEAVAEGGITRFLAVFYCQDTGQVGPVRSARTYYIDFMSEYGDSPLYAHVGGANQPGPADALGQLDTYGWTGYNDLNQFSIGFPTFWRDYGRLPNVATEHTMYSSVDKLLDFAKTNRKLTNVDENGKAWDTKFVPYAFTDDASTSQRGTSQSIHLEFWQSAGSDYFVDWTYNPKTNLYARANGGKPHIDKDTGKQLTAKNVVVLEMVEDNANDGYVADDHLLFENKGTGKAIIFKDGKRTNGTWEKDTRTSRTIVKDASGKQIQFDRGLIWFEVLPTDGVLTVK